MEWVTVALPAGPLADEAAALLAYIEDVAWPGLEVRGEDIVLYCPVSERDLVIERLRAAAPRLRDAGHAVDETAIRVTVLPPEEEWRDAWKKFFKVDRVSRQLVIVPSWEEFTPAPGDLVLALDPGRAFGTGAHASTRLCLRALQELADGGLRVDRFLDVGTGSGILALAAARLWPQATGIATDLDPIAVRVAGENLTANGVADRVTTIVRPIHHVDGQFELVLANIQADVLVEMASDLAARVAPGGTLVLAGVLATQAEGLAPAFTAAGLRWLGNQVDDADPEWVSLRLARS